MAQVNLSEACCSLASKDNKCNSTHTLNTFTPTLADPLNTHSHYSSATHSWRLETPDSQRWL